MILPGTCETQNPENLQVCKGYIRKKVFCNKKKIGYLSISTTYNQRNEI